jgi:hypothetical protein
MLRYITYSLNTTCYPPRPLPGAGIRSTFIYCYDVTDCFTVESPLTHLYDYIILYLLPYNKLVIYMLSGVMILVFFFGLSTLVWMDEYGMY